MTGTKPIIDDGKLPGHWRLADTPYGAALTGRS